MNVASLTLCKELYRLSGWKFDEYMYYDGALASSFEYSDYWTHTAEEHIPAYDLGYLLRKLPPIVGELSDGFSLEPYGVGWICRYNQDPDIEKDIVGLAATPEDAAAKLAIELHRQGVLRPNSKPKSKLGHITNNKQGEV